MPRWLLLIFVVLASLGEPLRAQTSQADLSARFQNKNLFLRGTWRNDKLSFDSGGHLVGNSPTASFTLSVVHIERFALKSDHLALDGIRLGMEFADGKPKLVKLDGGHEKIHIDIAAGPGGDYTAALDDIFTENVGDLVSAMPDFWQGYAKQHFQSEPVAAGVSPDPPKPANAEAAKIGGQVSAPVVLFSPEPKFSEEARHVGNLNGNVLVYLRVGLDGLPYAVRILRPFGVGLDERAVEAVKAYRFKPAMRDGQPVRVEMNVEVNFRRW